MTESIDHLEPPRGVRRYGIQAKLLLTCLLLFLLALAGAGIATHKLYDGPKVLADARQKSLLTGRWLISRLEQHIRTVEDLALSLSQTAETVGPRQATLGTLIPRLLETAPREVDFMGLWLAEPGAEPRRRAWRRGAGGQVVELDGSPAFRAEAVWSAAVGHSRLGQCLWASLAPSPAALCAIPLRRGEQRIGAVVVELTLAGLDTRLAQVADGELGGYAFLADLEGRFLVASGAVWMPVSSTIQDLAQEQPGLRPIAASLDILDHELLARVSHWPGGVDSPIQRLAAANPSLDATAARRMLASQESPSATAAWNFASCPEDPILRQPTEAVVLQSPSTGWRLVLVMPQPPTAFPSILRALRWTSLLTFLILAPTYWLLRRALVLPVRNMVRLLRQGTEGGQEQGPWPEARRSDELGELAFWYNRQTIQANEARQELLDAYEQLLQEIADRERVEEALYSSKERAQVTLESIGDAVITTGTDARVEYLNPTAEALLGWTLDQAKGLPLSDVLRLFDQTTKKPVENPALRCLREQRVIELTDHMVIVNRTGREIAIEDSAAPIRDRKGDITGVVMVFHDVTEARRLSRQIDYQARHDGLTGLVNRREFETRLKELVEDREEGARHALLYLDLDQFKVVNDTCGHVAGDHLLREISSVMQSKMKASDTLARLGGDEFGVLLSQCSEQEAHAVAERLRRAVESFRFVWDETTFNLGVSIGLVPILASSGTDMATILSHADTACYAAKDAGRNQTHIYQEGNSAPARRRGEMLWVSRIHRAFEEGRFRLFYQEIVPMAIDRPEPDPGHLEILLRMETRDGEIAFPGAFLPAAERYNLMPTLDRWVIKNVLELLSNHPEVFASVAIWGVNLSGTSLGDENFLEFLIAEIGHANLPAGSLCLEITETAAVANLANARRLIAKLKEQGCRFALDDFGAGMSSFAYLKNLPVDFLKIDGAFVKDIPEDPINYALVKSIHNIGHVMDMQTVAEFVDSGAVMSLLQNIGVDFGQGNWLGPPRQLEIEEIIQRRSAASSGPRIAAGTTAEPDAPQGTRGSI